jgi:hypothetical protein
MSSCIKRRGGWPTAALLRCNFASSTYPAAEPSRSAADPVEIIVF